MKLFKLIHKTEPSLNKILGNALNSLFSWLILGTEICLSHSQKNLSLIPFNNEISKDEFTQMGQPITSTFPTVDRAFTIDGTLFGRILALPSPKISKEPVNKTFISSGNCHKSLEKAGSSDFIFIPVIPDEEGPFPIDNSGQISQLSNSVVYPCILTFRHAHSCNEYACYYAGLKIKCIAAETNPNGIRKDEVIVRTIGKLIEEGGNDLLAA